MIRGESLLSPRFVFPQREGGMSGSFSHSQGKRRGGGCCMESRLYLAIIILTREKVGNFYGKLLTASFENKAPTRKHL